MVAMGAPSAGGVIRGLWVSVLAMLTRLPMEEIWLLTLENVRLRVFRDFMANGKDKVAMWLA